MPGFVERRGFDGIDDFAAYETDEVEPALALHEFGERGHRETLRVGSIHKKEPRVKARGAARGNKNHG